jgi:hypothetical protein
MQITHHKPAARGVTQLMYVGDDQAVETATQPPTKLAALLALTVIVGAGWMLLQGK